MKHLQHHTGAPSMFGGVGCCQGTTDLEGFIVAEVLLALLQQNHQSLLKLGVLRPLLHHLLRHAGLPSTPDEAVQIGQFWRLVQQGRWGLVGDSAQVRDLQRLRLKICTMRKMKRLRRQTKPQKQQGKKTFKR